MERAISAAVPAAAGRRSSSARRTATDERMIPVYCEALNSFWRDNLRFVTIQREGYQEPGVLSGGELIGLRAAGFPDMVSVIAGGADALDGVTRWAGNPPGGDRLDPGTVKLA